MVLQARSGNLGMCLLFIGLGKCLSLRFAVPSGRAIVLGIGKIAVYRPRVYVRMQRGPKSEEGEKKERKEEEKKKKQTAMLRLRL